ncbi:carbon-nitrogen hydrolase family protein [Ferviditalea candida]|uniref:Carbon-nitrogen hydrolase family protein n=1 Tax=Ferviditalea candida TaxID=3108399 RepID=A0ABU5ZJX2_9BACL|nr:carbon-nitrogen hydrolase family protein [Paenibacillaceae bacterium T2]
MENNPTLAKVAAIQMNCVLGDRDRNLEKASRLVEQAVQNNANMIVLPELFNTGYRVEEKDMELAEPIPGPTVEWMEKIASKYGVYMIAAILEKGESEGLIYDTAVLVGPEGLAGSYRKTHLWDQENVRFTKGDQFPVFATPYGRVGLQICYEVGFPEGSRILSLKGADIMVYPSAFGMPRLYAWDLATRSRALENGAFLIAANRTGVEKTETEFAGHSRIVDPLGRVLAEALEEDEVIMAEIDLQLVAKQRRTIPYLRDLNRKLISDEYI